MGEVLSVEKVYFFVMKHAYNSFQKMVLTLLLTIRLLIMECIIIGNLKNYLQYILLGMYIQQSSCKVTCGSSFLCVAMKQSDTELGPFI